VEQLPLAGTSKGGYGGVDNGNPIRKRREMTLDPSSTTRKGRKAARGIPVLPARSAGLADSLKEEGGRRTSLVAQLTSGEKRTGWRDILFRKLTRRIVCFGRPGAHSGGKALWYLFRFLRISGTLAER